MSRPGLQVTLESELPDRVAVGGGTALFVCGWCLAPRAQIRSLALQLDGEPPQPVMACGMPRLDPYRALGEEPGAYRSGFWGMLRVRGPRAPGRVTLSLRAWLQDGRAVAAPLGELALVDLPGPDVALPPWPGAAGPRVAICLAAHDPSPDLLRRQLDSIRRQTHGNWICLISDDASGPAGRRALQEAVGGDARFAVSRSGRRLGFYANFERALAMVPPDAQLVALSDQDDAWHPDKLAALIGALGPARLIYSDARVVSRSGEPLADTWWSARRPNHSDLLSLLVANSVTGAASLLRRDLLRDALPFPPAQFHHFHDHWVGLTARALGQIAYVDRPLYDYVQHGGAALGHAAANRMTTLRDRLAPRRGPAERVRLWRMHYFVDFCRLLQFAAVLQMRCEARMAPRERRALRRFLAADRSAGVLARLAVRGVRELTGTPETLGAEWMLLHALVWRRLVSATARDRPQRRLRLDALPPATLVQPPRRAALPEAVAAVAAKVAPLRWLVSESAAPRINILIPTLELRHLFGGYIAKFNLARRLAALGLRVRLVTVDPVGPLPADHRRRVESAAGVPGLFASVELAFGRESPGIEISPADRFVATTWWTAHIARHAVGVVGDGRFGYLIQEYEPFTFPMGAYAALAAESYRFPHAALFSTELLRGWFRHRGLGVYAGGVDAGDRASASFENAITPVPPPTEAGLGGGDRPRRLLFYARPEAHAARNMYELGLLALSRAVGEGAFAGWELHGIGTVGRGRNVDLGAGAVLSLLPRADPGAYVELLRTHDVGLALMYTPHPSLVPLEMASAGMLTVTNSFETKTAGALAAISENLIVAEPTVDGVASALAQAAAGAGDVARRVRGSRVRWSRDWECSLPDDLLRWLVAALGS